MRIASPYQTFDFFLFLTPSLMCACPQVRALDKHTCFWLKLAIFVVNIYSLFFLLINMFISNIPTFKVLSSPPLTILQLSTCKHLNNVKITLNIKQHISYIINTTSHALYTILSLSILPCHAIT